MIFLTPAHQEISAKYFRETSPRLLAYLIDLAEKLQEKSSYAIRPLSCRGFNSISQATCKCNFGNHDATVHYELHQYIFYLAAIDALRQFYNRREGTNHDVDFENQYLNEALVGINLNKLPQP